MSGLPWFRMYVEAIDDEKLRMLAFEDRWHFVALLCLKGSGLLDDKSDLRDRKIAVKMGLSLNELDMVKKRLSEVGLINEDLSPKSWNKRQFASDSSTSRVRKYRKNNKKQERNVDETFQERCSNDDVTAPDTDTDTDTDKKKNIKKKKSPIPDHFPITEKMEEYAFDKGVKGNLSEITEEFVLYHKKHGNKFVDWDSAWQGWIRKHVEFQKENSKEKEKQPWFMRGI